MFINYRWLAVLKLIISTGFTSGNQRVFLNSDNSTSDTPTFATPTTVNSYDQVTT